MDALGHYEKVMPHGTFLATQLLRALCFANYGLAQRKLAQLELEEERRLALVTADTPYEVRVPGNTEYGSLLAEQNLCHD